MRIPDYVKPLWSHWEILFPGYSAATNLFFNCLPCTLHPHANLPVLEN